MVVTGFEVLPMSTSMPSSSLVMADVMSNASVGGMDGNGLVGSAGDPGIGTGTSVSGTSGGSVGGVVGAAAMVLFGSAGAGKLRDDERQGLATLAPGQGLATLAQGLGPGSLGPEQGLGQGSLGGGPSYDNDNGNGNGTSAFVATASLDPSNDPGLDPVHGPALGPDPDASPALSLVASLDPSPGLSLVASPSHVSALSGLEAQCAYGNVMDLVAHLAHQGMKVHPPQSLLFLSSCLPSHLPSQYALSRYPGNEGTPPSP